MLPRGMAEYRLAGSNDTVYATVKFARGTISRITPGPALASKSAQDSLVERAAHEAAHIHGSFSATRLLLAERRLTGHFVWNDRFQINPCPATAPVYADLNWSGRAHMGELGEAPDGPPYPFTLQVRVAKSPNPFLQSSRVMRELDSFQHLLTLLVSGHIRAFDRVGERVWVLIRREEGIENHLLHPGFTFGGEADENHKDATFYQGLDYYNHLWGGDTELLLPPSIDKDLEAVLSLDAEESRAFKRATYWYALGIQNRRESTLSTVAFSTAIECLLPRPQRSRCVACNSQLGSGPTYLFKTHLSRYGSVPEALHKQRAELYDVRSALVHGSFAASIDATPFSVAGETLRHDMLLELVTRRSILNWLRDPNRKTWHSAQASSANSSA